MKRTLSALCVRARRGLSVLEFLGCLIAVIGGACLGAIYLGIDLHHVAYVALTESDLMEKVPEKWRPVDPGWSKRESHLGRIWRRQCDRSSCRCEPRSALFVANAIRSRPRRRNRENESPTAAADQEALAKEQTLYYWNRIHEIVREQAAMQREAESAANEDNATKLAALKGRINRFAASALRAIPTDDVDPAAHAVSKELADWYDRGWRPVRSGRRRLGVGGSHPRHARSPKTGNSPSCNLRNEGRLLGDKMAATRDSLTRRFNAEFAEIGRP